MRPDDIHSWLRRDPFQPFRLHISNGRSFDVTQPGMVWVGRNWLMVGDLDPDFPVPTVTTAHHVTLLHINHIEPLPQPAAAG